LFHTGKEAFLGLFGPFASFFPTDLVIVDESRERCGTHK
jgi:hypothetical protein